MTVAEAALALLLLAEGTPNDCKPIRLRTPGQQCYVLCVDGILSRTADLAIYDSDGQARVTRYCLPTWYGRATAQGEPWGPNGTELLVIRIEGNTGTSTLQTIGVGIGWRDDGYGLTFFETLDYELGGRRLRASVRRKNSTLQLQYTYEDAAYMEPARPTVRRSWTTDLTWSPSRFRYELQDHRAQRTSEGKTVTARAATARLAAFELGLSQDCGEAGKLVTATGIMDVLP